MIVTLILVHWWQHLLFVILAACEYCLRALETAEENARRLSGKPGLSLPHPELCKVRPELHQACPQCQVGSVKIIKTLAKYRYLKSLKGFQKVGH